MKVHEFLLPVIFIFMGSERVSLGCKYLSIIFGRPFMAITGAKLDVKIGTLSMNVLGKTIEFVIFKAVRYPNKVLCNGCT